MSSIRSASSRTRISTWPRLATFWPTRSSSRPGRRDEDLDAAAQGLDLGVHRDPAVDDGRAQRDGPAVGPDALVDLHRELAGRARGSARGPGGGPARSWCWPGRAGGRGWAARRRRSCRCRSGRPRGRRGPRARAGWRPPGRGSGSHTPPRRPCARGRPTGRVNRRSSVAPVWSRRGHRTGARRRPAAPASMDADRGGPPRA